MHSSDEDLLQFKDYSGIRANSQEPAKINVNSPMHSQDVSGEISNVSRREADTLSEIFCNVNTLAINGSMQNTGEVIGTEKSSSDNFDGNTARSKSGLSFLSIEYYQQFFNVDTYTIWERIASSMVPKRAPGNYLQSIICANPDMYGPFWITVTLILSITISGNIVNFLQHANEVYHWHYNFNLVSYAATCIFVYAYCVPALLWALFLYSLKPAEQNIELESETFTPSLLSLICIYGYSLSIYIPVSILWVIQISLIQWLLVLLATSLQGSALIFVLSPALRNSKIPLLLILGILASHFLLAAGFMLYFFHVPNTALMSTSDSTATIATIGALQKLVKVNTNTSDVVGNITL